MKKLITVLALSLSIMLLVSACSGSPKTANESAASEKQKEEASTKPTEKLKLKFYGYVAEFPAFQEMTKLTKEHFKDKYDIEFIQVDWGNLDKIVRTGIASGEPADIYDFWPMALQPYVANDMALDLTPYLEANGGEWKKTFIPTHLDMGKYNGKYYGIPYHANYSLIFANSDLLAKAGVTVPDKWTWDEFMAASKKIKEKTDAYPWGLGVDNYGAWQITNGIQSIAKSEGKLDDFANGKIDYTTLTPEFSKVFDNIRSLYAADYVYPGKGAATMKRDEVKAAFFQGKIAMMGDIAVNASDVEKNATNFKPVIISWPTMGTEESVLGGADGFFIPKNAAHPEASVEVLKYFTSSEIMKLHADSGYPVSFNNIEITNPIVKEIVKRGGNVYPKEFESVDPKLGDYVSKTLLQELVLTKSSNDELIKKMENLRKTAVK